MSEINIKGIGIVIDDKIFDNESEDSINQIVKNLEELGIPIVKFDSIPDDKYLDSFSEISFILLDWKLLKTPKPTNSQIKRQIVRNIKFIESLKSYTFAPIFIFSSESKVDIVNALEEAGIYIGNTDEDFKNHIFIERKKELINKEEMQKKIYSWVEGHPSVYLLKSWENAFSTSKNNLFWDLFDISPEWPRIIWENFEKESVDESSNLVELINLLVKSKIPLINLEKEIICKFQGNQIEEKDIENVITGTMYLKEFPENDLLPGDIFEDDDGFLINIRPVCDTVIGRKKGDGSDAFDGYIYALKGKNVKKRSLNITKYGVVIEKANEAVIYGFPPNDFLRFELNNLKKIEFESVKNKRVGRLLPPYINHIQNRYAFYLSRVGFPSLPNLIIPKSKREAGII